MKLCAPISFALEEWKSNTRTLSVCVCCLPIDFIFCWFVFVVFRHRVCTLCASDKSREKNKQTIDRSIKTFFGLAKEKMRAEWEEWRWLLYRYYCCRCRCRRRQHCCCRFFFPFHSTINWNRNFLNVQLWLHTIILCVWFKTNAQLTDRPAYCC